MAINRNDEIKKVSGLGDRVAERITKIAGSMPFLITNISVFIAWILINTGVFGKDLIVDAFPFGFLTMTVSIEAIVLSTFVLMSQRRQAKVTEIRTKLDYHADIQSEIDIKTIVAILERIAKSQDVEITDLLTDMRAEEKASVDEQAYARL